jgi:mono/diheme cytochrome c family protein
MLPVGIGGFAMPLLLLTAFSASAAAQAQGDTAVGRTIAETWCSACHVVTPTQAQGASTGAPPFQAIAAQTAITPMALRAFLQTPHHRMPDLQLSRDQIDDVSAYILSLRPPPKP